MPPAPLPEPPSPWWRAPWWRAWLADLERRLLEGPAGPGPGTRARTALRSLWLAWRGCIVDHIGDRAAALSFATLLSLLPLILLGLAGLGLLGLERAHLEELRPALLRWLVPATADALVDGLERSLDTLGEASRTLGLTGVVLLLWTGWGLLSTLGRTFQRIWGRSGLVGRLSRMLAFWSAVVFAPSLVLASLYLHGTVLRIPGADALLNRLTGIVLSFLTALAAYLVLPARPARLRPAAIGAAAAAMSWEILKVGFAWAMARAFLLDALLAGLGAVPIFLVWLFLGWGGFIFGAELAFAIQEPERARKRGRRRRVAEPAARAG